MDHGWNDNQPIYRQIRDRVVEMILDGTLPEGSALPSVRTVAADTRVNPLTVMKGYQELVDESLVEKRRGLGLFVCAGTAERLRATERERFRTEQWPAIEATIHRLGLADELLGSARGRRREPER